jgi:hypothetical protein
MPLDNFPYLIGIIALVISACLILVRHARLAGRLVEGARKQEEGAKVLEGKIGELRAQKTEKEPQLEELLQRTIDLREQRDQLLNQYNEIEESLEKKRERELLPGELKLRVER